MPNLSDLHLRADLLIEEIEDRLSLLRQGKRKLLTIEDSLVEKREELLLIKESIRTQELATDFASLIDSNRAEDITGFRVRNPKTKE